METATRIPDSATDEEISRLRALVPLHTLPDKALDALLDEVSIVTLGKGKLLFEQGDTNHEHVYLLDGVVALLEGGKVADTVRAGTDTARFPLAHQIPRRHSARADGKVRIARLDSRRLSDALARTQTVDYQVSDLGEAGDDDWMGMLLQSRILQQVPAANIQRVMMSVEQVEVGAGEDLVRQGDPGDFYYMLTAGRAAVLRDGGDGRGAVELATLGPGDAFGEEALLSDNPRNSTVTMLEDGAVLRLGKDQFLDLIHSPLLDRIDMAAAQAKVEQGALWLDVRSSEQFDESHLPGAINCPFESLRYQSASLSPDHHYVLYSNTGGRAMASAFLLTERGFHVSVLAGGLRAADRSAGGTLAAEISAAPPPAVDDDIVRARLREAEQRAHELEQRLREVEKSNQDAQSERERQLEQVRTTIDQARRKLVETEEQKREALEAQQQAYAEMERLTSSLEQVENERASLQDRMAEIEGLDKQLQARLMKAERELIGASERAESATSSLEELSDRLSEVLEQREQERSRHALERGELKEEMTALQLDLEQAQQDLEELREHLGRREAGAGEAEQRLAEVSAALAQSMQEQEGLAAERDRLRAGLEELQAARVELQQRLDVLEEQAPGQAARTSDLERELTAARGRVSELEAALDEAGSAAEATAAQAGESAELRAALADAAALRATLEERLQAAETQARNDHETVNRLEAEKTELNGRLAAGDADAQAALDELRASLRIAREDAAAQAQALHQELEQAHSGRAEAGERLDELQQQLDTLHNALAERDAEIARLAESGQAAQAESERTSADALARITELEQRLAESAAALDEARAGSQALDAERAHIAELETRLATAEAAALQVGNDREGLQSELAAARATLEQQAAEAESVAALSSARQDELDALKAEHAQALAALEEARRASAGNEAATAAVEQRQTELEADNAALAVELAQVREELAQQVEAAIAESEQQLAWQNERAALQQELTEARAEVARQLDLARELDAQLGALRRSVEAGQQAGAAATAAEEALQAELRRLAQRLEERELALSSARSGQAELIEALDLANTERESLQITLNGHEEALARIAELENELIESQRDHDATRQRLQALTAEAEAVQPGAAPESADDVAGLHAALAAREAEVAQLRGVIAEHVDRIRSAHDDDAVSELEALRTELAMVREQAARDAAHMREQLAAAEMQKLRMHQADEREAISHEAMRQRIESLEASLAERQRDLQAAEEARHMLEDALEDANRHLDGARLEHDRALQDADAAVAGRREAEQARDQLKAALEKLQENAELVGATDLRDVRLSPQKTPLGFDSLGGARRWPAALIGLLLGAGGVAAWVVHSGNGRIFDPLRSWLGL